MARGFLAGIFWGGIVGLTLLAISSQVMDRRVIAAPQPQATPVEVPAGTEFDQARPETDPVVPEVEDRPDPEAISGVTPPEDLVEAPPAFDTSALEMPQPSVEGPGGLGDLPELVGDVDVTMAGPGDAGLDTPEAPLPGAGLAQPDVPAAAPETQVAAPEPGAAPEPEAEPEAAGEPAAQEAPAPAASEGRPIETPDAAEVSDPGGEIAEAPSAPAPALAPMTAESPAIETGPGRITLGPETAFQPVTRIGNLDAGVTTDRLPQVGADPVPAPLPEPEPAPVPEPAAETGTAPDPDTDADAATAEPETPVVPAPAVETDPPAGAAPSTPDAETDAPRIAAVAEPEPEPVIRRGIDPETPAAEEPAVLDIGSKSPGIAAAGNALEAFARPFDLAAAEAAISLVLVHDAPGPPDAETLAALPETVAFAVDTARPDAREVAAAYRAAGREVVMIPALPQLATPQDVEVALSANFDAVPEAVAVMDVTGRGFQSDRAAVAQVVDVVADTGHGVITFPRGLNTAHRRAVQAGVPTGLIFRDMDGDGQDGDQIQRALDRAAFRARQEDPVILVGRTHPATISAIEEWLLGGNAAGIALAPVSAVLLDG